MGLLDFLNTPQGQALASGVASYAVNARRGRPVNSIGAGLMGGIQGYSGAIEAQRQAAQDEQRNEYNRKQQELLGYEYDSKRMQAETNRKKLEQERQYKQAEVKMTMPGFLKASNLTGQGFDIGEDGEVIFQDNPNILPVSANMPFLADAGDEYRQMIDQGLADPTTRKQALNEAYRYYRERQKGTKEAKDVIAKERAMAEAMGIPLKQYLQDKSSRSGVNVTVQNYGEPKAVQMPDGSQGLVRFGKDVNAPPVIVPFSPPASDTEQMAAGYADRMKESDAVIKNIGTPGNPTLTTSIIGSLGDYPQRLVMTKEQQMHRQAQEDWVRAKLRKESGAVIADEEMEREINVYFPKPGDTKEVIAQKERARAQAVQSMYKTAGPAAQKQQAKPNFSVVAPNGKTYSFPDANSLANFKKSAGIK